MSDLEELLASFESSLDVSAVPESLRGANLLRAPIAGNASNPTPIPAARTATHGQQPFNLPLPISLGTASVSQASTQAWQRERPKASATAPTEKGHLGDTAALERPDTSMFLKAHARSMQSSAAYMNCKQAHAFEVQMSLLRVDGARSTKISNDNAKHWKKS